MSNYYETGPVPHHSASTVPYEVTVTAVGLVSPSVSASRAYDITDPDSVTAVTNTVLSGSASISTTIWTTPAITALTAGKRYRVETDINDSANVHTFVLFVNCPY